MRSRHYLEQNDCFNSGCKGHIKSDCHKQLKCQTCEGHHLTCFQQQTGLSSQLSRQEPPERADHEVNVNAIDTLSSVGETTISNCLTAMILPFYISLPTAPDDEILAYALLDSMSNTSIIAEDLCDSIQTP